MIEIVREHKSGIFWILDMNTTYVRIWVRDIASPNLQERLTSIEESRAPSKIMKTNAAWLAEAKLRNSGDDYIGSCETLENIEDKFPELFI